MPNALAVPVTALLAQPGGGYSVEVVHKAGADHLVAVSLGLFDDAQGLVQVTGSRASQRTPTAVAGGDEQSKDLRGDTLNGR